jgi:hypothetical protein
VNEKYGRIRAFMMYREMTVAPGEYVLVKRLGEGPEQALG